MVGAICAEAAVDFKAPDLLGPADYNAAFDAYAAGRCGLHATALNRAADVVAVRAASVALEALYQRLMVLANSAAEKNWRDRYEFGLRVAAVEARALGRSLAGGEDR